MKLGTIILGVAHLDASIAFYRDAVGLKFQGRGGDLAFFDGGGIALMLREAAALGVPSADLRRIELVLHVADIDAAHATLVSRGVTFRLLPREVTPGQLAADFRDPDGHVLSIYGPRSATH